MASRISRWHSIIVLVMLFIACPLSAQELVEKPSFEGIVGYELKDFQALEPFTVYMKSGRLRIEANDQGVGNAFLVDYRAKKGYIIISGREQYVELPVIVPPSKTTAKLFKIDFQKTDATEDILDYLCEQFLLTSENVEVEVWATKGLGAAGTFLLPQVLEWQWKIIEMGYFPMRVIERDSTGDETSRFEVVSVRKKSMNSSLFRIPPGYEKVGPEALEPRQATKKKRSR